MYGEKGGGRRKEEIWKRQRKESRRIGKMRSRKEGNRKRKEKKEEEKRKFALGKRNANKEKRKKEKREKEKIIWRENKEGGRKEESWRR